jgi:hypothetical protein
MQTWTASYAEKDYHRLTNTRADGRYATIHAAQAARAYFVVEGWGRGLGSCPQLNALGLVP